MNNKNKELSKRLYMVKAAAGATPNYSLMAITKVINEICEGRTDDEIALFVGHCAHQTKDFTLEFPYNKRLSKYKPNDEDLFRGHGWIQIKGRNNYTKCARWIVTNRNKINVCKPCYYFMCNSYFSGPADDLANLLNEWNHDHSAQSIPALWYWERKKQKVMLWKDKEGKEHWEKTTCHEIANRTDMNMEQKIVATTHIIDPQCKGLADRRKRIRAAIREAEVYEGDERYGIIYTILCERRVMFVGKTTHSLKILIDTHLSAMKSSSTPLYKNMRKCGMINLMIMQIDEGLDKKHLQGLLHRWIRHYATCSLYGTDGWNTADEPTRIYDTI